MSSPRAHSVRRQLLVLLLTVVCAGWIAAALVSFGDARHEVAEVLDAHLTQTASLVRAQWGGGDDEIDTEHAPMLHRYNRRVMFQVWEGTRLRLHSQNAPDTPLSPVRDGFSDAEIGGSRWRVFSAWSPRDRVVVQVAEQLRERDELATAIARNFVLPLAIALPILAAGIWAAVGRAMRPLTDVNQQVARRTPENLTAIDLAEAPSEIGALVTNLNALFGRVQELIEHERRFTADAAHELRTPIAAVRAQAQVARGALNPDERAHALDGVIAGCDRAARLVEQMLTLARLQPDSVSFESTPVDVAAILRDTIRELTPAALAKRIDLGLSPHEPAFVSGNAGLLGILVRNVIDNAIRYSPADTTVDVGVDVSGAAVSIDVSDAGPGIPEMEGTRIGERFYRIPGRDASGSGLGLSIVRRILDLHGGTMQLDRSNAGGLHVTIKLLRHSR
jgi:two-component system sensor histidine kinase QseC